MFSKSALLEHSLLKLALNGIKSFSYQTIAAETFLLTSDWSLLINSLLLSLVNHDNVANVNW